MKHPDALVIQIDEFQVIELLQREMARVKKYIASRMVANALQKHFKRHSVMQIFPRMNLKAQIHSRLIECIQNRPPPPRQLIKRRLNQPGWSLRPPIKVRPPHRPPKHPVPPNPPL